MAQDDTDAPDRAGLRDYARALRRRWGTALLVLGAIVVLAIGYSVVATPQYLATADVLIEPSGADSDGGSGSRVDAEEVATQTQVVTSLPVARLVQQQLSLSTAPDLTEVVAVKGIGSSRILRISAEDTSADRAARTANTVSTAYLQFRRAESIGRYEQARERLIEEQAGIESRLEEVDALVDEGAGGQRTLQTERRTLLTTLAQIETQIDTLSDSLTAAAAGGELLRPAETPENPVWPRPMLNLVLGGLLGLMLGVGAALLRDRFDDAVHDEEDVREALGAVVVGRVPQWSERAHRNRLVTLMDPHAPASEEYQRLGVNMRFMLATDAASRASGAIVLTTSGQEGEGKTVTSCNLAVAAARLGLRVIVVDADFRRASVGPRFGLGDPPGLSDLLVGEDSSASFLIDIGVERLRVLPAGTLPPNPAALLSSPRMRLVLADLALSADLVIVDSPPVMVGADSLELANLADMVIVVARERVSRRRQLVSVRETLRHVSASSVGIVLNGLGDAGRATYSYTPRERDISSDRPADGRSPVVDPEPQESPTPARDESSIRRS